MIGDPYSERVRTLFDAPAHAGVLEGASTVTVDDQGVRIQLSADVADGSIKAMRFLAWGCPHVIAAAEAVCAGYEGRAASDLDVFRAAELMQSLAVPTEKSGRILVIEDAVRSLGAMLRGISGSDS
ncbi:MAG: iron-sulfur cluster assembly scaffold protein [Woeseiaceae bacterium]